jgi:hypothetical protein
MICAATGFTGKPRDHESGPGLEYFSARYCPEGPCNDQDGNDPQSWNLYSSLRNNPLVATDPTGMLEQKPPDPWAPGGALFVLWWHSLWNAAAQTQKVAQQTWNYIKNPENWEYPSCVAGKMGT